jgi:hypothetical protein
MTTVFTVVSLAGAASPVSDTNVLSNLVTRTTRSWFTGVTYTFASLR